MSLIFSKKHTEWKHMISTLEALSPLKIMDRGYSLAYSDDGRLVKSVNQVKKDEQLQIKLTDGSILCKVQDIEEDEKS
jgi:exodeoxyribonuclease VII large subunit